MILKTIVVGSIMENCYLAGDANELLVIDPGGDAEKILAEIEKNSYRVKYIVVTHCHSDHIGAVNAVKERTGAKIVLSERSIRKKIMRYFEFREKRDGSSSFCIEGSRQDFADYLSVDKSALSRELNKMKKDGLIDFNGDNFTILQKL